MKTRKNGSWLTLAMLLFGIIAFSLRRQLYLTAVDDKNLLLRGTPLEQGLLLLTVGVLIFLLLALRKTAGFGWYEDHYGASILAAVGHVAMALAILYTMLTERPSIMGHMGTAWRWLGLAAPFCLLLAGRARQADEKPFFGLHVEVCMFLIVHIVNHYQLWSSNPQTMDYLFSLLSMIALALFAYYTAAFETDCGNCRMVRLTGLAAVYLCLAELGWSTQPLLYLGGMLWALTSMCSVESAAEEMD